MDKSCISAIDNQKERIPALNPAFFLFPFLIFLVLVIPNQAQPVAGDSAVTLNLQQALDLGLANSYKLKAANLSVEISKENLSQQKTDQLPGIDLGLDGYLINDPTLFVSPPFGEPEKVDYSPYQVSGSVMVSQVIYSGSRIKNSIDQRVVEKKMADYTANKTSSDIKMTIVNEFLKLFSLLKDYYINIQTIQQIELRLKTLRSKFINGQVVKNDVSRSELQKSDFELKLLHTVSNASATNYLLTLLLGLPDNVVITIDTNLNYASDTTFVFEECLSTAFANRPEYQLALANKELSANSLKIIRSTYYPTIHGVGLYGLQNPVPGTFPPEAKFLSFLTVGAGINYSLGSLYKTNHQKSSAELSVLREDENIADMKITISDEVKSQFTQYEMQRKALSIYEKKIQYAGENYRIIQSRYYNDQALISDMVDAELEYNQARLDLITGQVQTRKEYYKLLKAIGRF